MSDNKKITPTQTPFSSPITPKASEPIGAPKGPKAPSAPSISTASTPPISEKIEAPGAISLPSPKKEPNPEVTSTSLEKLAQELDTTIELSGENAQALLDQFQKSGAKELSPEQKDKLKEILSSRTPEENKQSAEEALLHSAIESGGEFTEKFKEMVQNPELVMPSGSDNEIKEKFSFFTLLLLLNQLAAFSRDMAAKGMQLEQLSIQIKYDEKISNINTKSTAEFWTSIVSSVTSGVLGISGAIAGGSTTAIGTGFIKTSEMLGSLIQSAGKFGWISPKEAEREKIGKEESGHNFSQQQFKSGMDASDQQKETLIRTAEQLTQDQTIKTIARNI